MFSKKMLAILPRLKEVLESYESEKRSEPYLPHPFKVIEVNPNEIDYICSINEYTRKVKKYKELDIWTFHPGDWPEKSEKKPISDLGVVESVRKRVYEGVGWESTPIFQNKMRAIERKGVVDGCRSEFDLIKKYRERDVVIESILSDGFKGVRFEGEFPLIEDALSVSVGPLGEKYLGTGGLHRLAIAKVVGLQKIPVLVLTRHPEWIKKLRIYYDGGGSKIFRSVMEEHPDIA